MPRPPTTTRSAAATAGNERLTAMAGALLLVLLAAEGVTILFLRPLLPEHVFVGMLLVPPVLLKLASTGYRFARYYTGSPAYRRAGPPHPLLRLLAPLLVLSTVGVLATGVALALAGPPSSLLVGLHKASFVVWLAVAGVHVLAHLRRVPRLALADWRPRPRLRGRGARGVLLAGSLAAGTGLAVAIVPLASPWRGFVGDGGGEDGAAAAVRPGAVKPAPAPRPRYPAYRALGLPPVPRSPVPGYLLIADRNNDRLVVVSPDKRIVWRFPRPGDLRRGQSFRDPDDAFFTPGYRGVSVNEEFNQQIAEVSLRRRRLAWSYGRAGVPGSGRDELSNPDDAYVLPNGQMLVADIRNCRVLRVRRNGTIAGEIGAAGRCVHDPPRSLLQPNGATPLPDGGVLVTEIGGYVDRIDARGRLRWSIRSPTSYPSDAQLLPDGDVLVAGFDTPGRVDVLRPDGRVVWTYGPPSGPGSLDRPSLAVRWPNGLIAVTDDWHHRVVVIDPRTKRIVWQYGHLGVASSAPGYLSKPDGLDLLPAPVAARARRPRRPPAGRVDVRRVGGLPAAVSRLAAVALPAGRVLAAGGLVGGASSGQVLLGPPARLRRAATLPAPTHDAAAARVGGAVELFGGGEATSSDAVVRLDAATGAARPAGRLDEPLSDLGAVRVAGRAYLVGGYTGSRFATAVLRVGPGAATSVVARLPAGLRYAGVAALDGRIYVAGGVEPAGETASVVSVDPRGGAVHRVATLPRPVAHAPLVALDGALYLVGGRDAAGRPLARVLRIDPRSGAVSVAGRLPVPLEDAAAVALPGRAIVLGGGTASVFRLEPRRG